MTLSNLRYRRMSLVRDYGELADDTAVNPAFEATFAIAPREARAAPTETLPLSERFHVVPCDPTQTHAIALARSGASYIIQGPPGTGKSQTITNLIADFVVRGKRVLFVCEKRAAIDVVYHRLKQRGLHELCCLIHDSQADKKEFVMDLKATYESHLAASDERRDQAAGAAGDSSPSSRETCSRSELFDAAMQSVPDSCALPLRSTLDRRIRLAEHAPDLSPLEWERIPFYSDWHRHRAQLTELAETIGDVQPDGILAHHPLHLLSGKVADAERPLELVSRCLDAEPLATDAVADEARPARFARAARSTLCGELRVAVDYARQATFLARSNAMSILNAQSDAAKRWQARNRKDPSMRPGTSRRSARRRRPGGKNCRRTTPRRPSRRPANSRDECFRFSSRPGGGSVASSIAPTISRSIKVRPSWIRILDQLREEHQAVARRDELARTICSSFGLEGDFDQFEVAPSSLQKTVDKLPDSVRSLHVMASAGGDGTILALAALSDDLGRLVANCDEFLEAYWHCGLPELEQGFGEMEDSLDELPDYLHCLSQLNAIPAEVGRVDQHLSDQSAGDGGGDRRTQPAAGLARSCRRSLRWDREAAARVPAPSPRSTNCKSRTPNASASSSGKRLSTTSTRLRQARGPTHVAAEGVQTDLQPRPPGAGARIRQDPCATSRSVT